MSALKAQSLPALSTQGRQTLLLLLAPRDHLLKNSALQPSFVTTYLQVKTMAIFYDGATDSLATSVLNSIEWHIRYNVL
ncbi:MAG: hypothetical protein PUP92_17480, partial [Rhizonema sp. PD38]|nr:hypothetical protein [Rhizonema sp. PD38]